MDNLLFPGMIDPIHDEAQKKTLLTALHEMLRRDRGKVVVPYQPPELGRNYCRVGVKVDDGPALWILLNPAAGLVAAAEMGSGPEIDEIVQGRRIPWEHWNHAFVDVPHALVFSRSGFRVASAEEMNQPVGEQHLRKLGGYRQWVVGDKTENLGGVFFNWYD